MYEAIQFIKSMLAFTYLPVGHSHQHSPASYVHLGECTSTNQHIRAKGRGNCAWGVEVVGHYAVIGRPCKLHTD